MDPRRISVLVPAYNHAAYVTEALNSAFGQSRPAGEVIVVDDGSNDGTQEIVRAYGDRVRLFTREHHGLGPNYEFALRQATGDWVAFLESDDVWDPDYLAACAEFVEQHPDVEWVSTTRCLIDEHSRPTGELFGKRTAGPYYTTKGFLLHDMGRASTPVARRDALLAMAPFLENSYAVDSDLSLRFSVGHGMGHVDRPLYRYRRHSSNASGDRVRDAMELLKILRRFQADGGDWVRGHSKLVRRGVAKFAGRTGALMLEADPGTPRDRVLPLFREAMRLDPLTFKHLRRYLTVTLFGSRAFGKVKRRRRG